MERPVEKYTENPCKALNLLALRLVEKFISRQKNVATFKKIYKFGNLLIEYSQSTGICGKVRFLHFSLNFAFATNLCRRLKDGVEFSTFCSFLLNSFSTGRKMPKNSIKSRVYGTFQQNPQPLLFTITNIYFISIQFISFSI